MLKGRKQNERGPILRTRSVQQTRSRLAHIEARVELKYRCPTFELVTANSVPCGTAEHIVLNTISSDRGYKEIGIELFQDL